MTNRVYLLNISLGSDLTLRVNKVAFPLSPVRLAHQVLFHAEPIYAGRI